MAFGHAIAFNLQTLNLGLWPRDRVQPSNFKPWPLATRSRSTFKL
ncbi:hypothetical protein [Moorena sp. SIO4G3]|nr:hypothetical protein [Moorena sp. SIO4G3]